MKIRNIPTPDGRAVGEHLARWTEKALAEALSKYPNQVHPCSTCAFRRGTHPNGCVTTVMDALKCVMERHPFLCHESQNEGRVCAGWFLLQGGSGAPVNAQWKFSDEYTDADLPLTRNLL